MKHRHHRQLAVWITSAALSLAVQRRPRVTASLAESQSRSAARRRRRVTPADDPPGRQAGPTALSAGPAPGRRQRAGRSARWSPASIDQAQLQPVRAGEAGDGPGALQRAARRAQQDGRSRAPLLRRRLRLSLLHTAPGCPARGLRAPRVAHPGVLDHLADQDRRFLLELRVGLRRHAAPGLGAGALAFLPAIIEVPGGPKLAIAEADLEDYPGFG